MNMKKIIMVLSLLASQVVIAAPSLPFPDAVIAGNTMYLSGQLGTEIPGGFTLVPGGIGPETKQAMENIKTVLAKYHSSLSQLSKCTVLLADIRDWAQMNEVYVTFFPNGRYPARSSFGTTGLALGARVEIECIATIAETK